MINILYSDKILFLSIGIFLKNIEIKFKNKDEK